MQHECHLRTVALVAALFAGVLVAGCRTRPATVTDQELHELLPPIRVWSGVTVEGRVVPRRHATLSFGIAGSVAEVFVEEGDSVEANALLARLDNAQLREAVAEADAAVAAARAQLARLEHGATEEEIAVAEAAVEVARATVHTAQGALAAAQANLARLRSGATEEELAIAERQVELARNALWSAQAQRDTICGQVEHGAPQSLCDSAQGTVQRAEEEVRIAELRLQQVLRGPTVHELEAAEAQVRQAQGQLASARAGVAQAEATLAQVRRGATEHDLAAARAQVEQAEAAARRARAALARAELRAPFDGTVVDVNLRLGEETGPGMLAVQIADLTEWEVETVDLTELQVVEVAVGQSVYVIPDAMPERRLQGTVRSVSAVPGRYGADVVYQVRVTLNEGDERLRWGMTVQVEFEA